MKRTFSIEEWNSLAEKRRALSLRAGLAPRPTIDAQTRKGRHKRAVLRRLYGPFGQAGKSA